MYGSNTVVHDFNGHEVNGIHGLNGKKCYDKALYLVNNRHDFKGMHDFKGNFPYDDFFRKTHARLYSVIYKKMVDISFDPLKKTMAQYSPA